jgi:hypothetical protein
VFGRLHKDFWPAKIVIGSLHNWLGCTAGACFVVFGGLRKWSSGTGCTRWVRLPIHREVHG